MKLALRVFYQPEFLPVVCSFVSTTAQVFGASDKEQSQLGLAAEEAMMHILESFPPEDREDVFEVTCTVRDGGLEFEFNNLGLPPNIEALPTYNIDAPDQTEEGLRLHLMRQMVDRLEFINRGHEGWRTCFFKSLAAPRQFKAHPEIAPLSESQEKITAHTATPADAYDIVQLAYLTYRYSYAKEFFYFVDQLKAELQSDRLVSFVARTSSGQIVGHMARLLDPDCSAIAEVGAVMIRPEYRSSTGMLALLKAVLRYRDALSERIQLATSNLVTAHPLSQKLAAIMGYKPLAIFLSTHPRAQYQAMQVQSGRESNLYTIKSLCEIGAFPLHVPASHATLAERLFANAGLPASISTSQTTPMQPKTVWIKKHENQTHYAKIKAQSLGADFADVLRTAVYELSIERVETIALHLPAWQPLPEGIERALFTQSFFFCGFVASTPQKWFLLYARLSHQRFDFDSVCIHDPVAGELKDYIRLQYETLIPTGTQQVIQ